MHFFFLLLSSSFKSQTPLVVARCVLRTLQNHIRNTGSFCPTAEIHRENFVLSDQLQWNQYPQHKHRPQDLSSVIIFAASTCFDQDIMEGIQNKFLNGNLPPGSLIITYDKSLPCCDTEMCDSPSDQVEIRALIGGWMSWDYSVLRIQELV